MLKIYDSFILGISGMAQKIKTSHAYSNQMTKYLIEARKPFLHHFPTNISLQIQTILCTIGTWNIQGKELYMVELT